MNFVKLQNSLMLNTALYFTTYGFQVYPCLPAGVPVHLIK